VNDPKSHRVSRVELRDPARDAMVASRSVVLLHGFGGQPAMWDGLAEGAVAPLLPGHGAEPRIPQSCRFDDVVAELAADLLPASCIVGYSMGARLALAMALSHPGKVDSLLLIGVNPGLSDDEERERRARWDEDHAARLTRDGVPAFVRDWEKLPLFASQTHEQRARQRPGRLAHTSEGLAWAMRVLGLGNMPPQWGRLGRAALRLRLVVGGLDAKFVGLAQQIASQAPNASHRIVPDVGHNVVLEARDVVAVELAALALESRD